MNISYVRDFNYLLCFGIEAWLSRYRPSKLTTDRKNRKNARICNLMVVRSLRDFEFVF
jgi:hypothetical protein